MQRIPPITAALLIANILVFLLQQAQPEFMLAKFALWPLGPHEMDRLRDGTPISVGFEIWQIVTYAFLHGSFMHIAFNMIALWSIGGQVELALGHAALHRLLLRLRARRGGGATRHRGVDESGRSLSDARCLRRRVRRADRVRVSVPAGAIDDHGADPDSGAHRRHRLSRHRIFSRRHRTAIGCRALRASRRCADRIPAAPVLALAEQRRF